MDLSKGPSLYEFLIEAELQQYYTCIKSGLKIQNTSQLKYVTDEDLMQLGMSKPEMRRLKKYFNKYYPQNYLSKFKKMLLSKKEEQGASYLVPNALDSPESRQDRSGSGGGPRVPNKHIISAENIVVNKELGMGEFGVVQQGVWTNDGDRIQVAIKCLSRERMQSNPIEFLKEAAIMHSIDHEHVVRLYGVVLQTDSLMLVTELAPLRSLLECLKEPSLRASFPVLTLCDFALQICDGMQYLEAKRLIHRDLAARNILVFSKNKVKISDFGLSRALGQGKDYYQTNFNVHLKLPIAWCAPECISYLRFTSASDVWAYGVTLWEMFSYGFQPWAALTGHQILEAIDEPNYQRLDQPECCPKEYFTLMLRCWAHEPTNRPTFAELMTTLPECRPEQLQAAMNTPPEFSNANADTNSSNSALKREYLQFRIGDIITVLDKEVNSQLWKGILTNGKSGLFNPAHTVAYIGTNLPNSNKPETFSRSEGKYSSTRRKLRTEMISSPQGDLKHTSHIGLDGAFFGDISFFRGNGNSEEKNSGVSQLPRQIVTPFRPHEDMDQTPLLGSSASSNVFLTPNTPPPSSHSSLAPISLHASDHIALSVRQLQQMSGPCSNESISNRHNWNNHSQGEAQVDHEYHEISDEENLVAESPRFEKAFEYGPSLLEEIESVFRNSPNLSTPSSPLENITKYNENIANKYNEIRELSARLSSRPKKQATVKPISAHDQKILDSAIELATEITARSLNDLDAEPVPVTPASPTKRKFSFRFPLSGHGDADAQKTERRNFSDEAQSIPELQSTLTEQAQLAYESLIDTPSPEASPQYRHQLSNTTMDNPLRMLRSGKFPLIKPRTRLHAGNTLGAEHRLNHVSKRSKKGELKSKTWHRCSDDRGKGKSSVDCTDGNGDDDDVFIKNREDVESTLSFKKPCSSVSDESNCGDNSHMHDLHSPKANENICIPPSYSEYQRENNPIPLPPRDRTKPQLVSKTRHQRMFPLNIPESSIQRTLNKINAINSDEGIQIDFCENPIRIIPDSEINMKPSYVNCNPFNSKNNRDEPDFDTQSLHFEAQIDSTLAALDKLNLVPDDDFSEQNHQVGDIVDGPFAAEQLESRNTGEKESTNGKVSNANAKVKNVIHVIYNKKIENVSPKSDKSEKLQQNSGANGNAMEDVLRHNTDHVSFEDLLHFDGKPSSRARGIDSDEVRIMSKVLGAKVSSQQCLLALEHSNWDVHKAIKLTKLQNLLKVSLSADNPFVDLSTCNEALETNQWDLKKAANWIVAANQDDDITLV